MRRQGAAALDPRRDAAVAARRLEAARADQLVELAAGGAGAGADEDHLVADRERQLGEREQVDALDDEVAAQLLGRDRALRGEARDHRQVLGLNERDLPIAAAGAIAGEPALGDRDGLTDDLHRRAARGAQADP
jgi:hypothetical protein